MIIDCFPFFDELDLLEIRLHELQDVVDVFVLTESPYTFTGIEKPLHFQENKDKFKGFDILHTVYRPDEKCSPMEYETYQKQFNLDSAFNVMHIGDVLAHGDVDEIPMARAVVDALNDDWNTARFVMPLFYYYMNCKGTDREYKNTRLVRYTGPFKYITSQKFSVDRKYYNCGWHFSFLGDVQSKLEAWGHAPEYNKPPYNTPEHIKNCKDHGIDLVMRKGSRKINFEFITDDLSYLPQHVLSNMDKFSKYIKL